MSEQHSTVTEIWRPIPGIYSYEASSAGRIRSLDRIQHYTMRGVTPVARTLKGRILSPSISTTDGRYHVEIRGSTYLVHRLVLLAFAGPSASDMQACHNNGNPLDNRIENLRWATPKENFADMVRHGRAYFQKRVLPARKKLRPGNKISEQQAREIYMRAKNKERYIDIANDFGVSHSTVSHIANGRNWFRISGKPSPKSVRPRLQGDVYMQPSQP